MIPSSYRIQVADVTESTNDDVKKLAAGGEAEGLVLKARRQTKGKGRQGRQWESPEGNLYMSLLLRPNCTAQQAGLYSFIAAMALHDALHELAPKPWFQTKWPNDILVDDQKISGILLETSLDAEGIVEWLVLGVGVNVETHPEDGIYPVTSLKKLGVNVEVDDVLEAFLTAFEHWKKTFEHDGFRPIRRAWLAEARTGDMVVRLPGKELKGKFAGLDQEGRLILRGDDGCECLIDAGDVFFPTDQAKKE